MNRKNFIGTLFGGIGLAAIVPVLPSFESSPPIDLSKDMGAPRPHHFSHGPMDERLMWNYRASMNLAHALRQRGYKCDFHLPSTLIPGFEGPHLARTYKLGVRWGQDEDSFNAYIEALADEVEGHKEWFFEGNHLRLCSVILVDSDPLLPLGVYQFKRTMIRIHRPSIR